MKKVWQFIMIAVFIYSNFSYMALDFSEPIRIAITIMTIIVYQVISTGSFKLEKKSLGVTCVMLLLIIISCIVNFVFDALDIGIMLKLIVAFLMICAIDIKEFAESYKNVMVVLSCFSLLVFVIQIINPSIFENFPTINSTKWFSSTSGLHNVFVSVVRLKVTYIRNFGIFYEPGQFAFFINLAIYFMLFITKKVDIKSFIILAVTLITTTSTSGYISIALILLAFLFKKRINSNKEEKSKETKIRIYLLIITIFLIIGTTIFFVQNNERWHFLVDKLTQITRNDTEGSGYERKRAIELAIKAIYQNPVFGVTAIGQYKLSNGEMGSFTPLQWFSTYGLIYGLICNLAVFKFNMDKDEKRICNIIKYVAIISMIITQNMSSNIIILMIIIHTIESIIRRKHDNSNSSDIQYREIS